MSALPPKADIHCGSRDVRFVPIADIVHAPPARALLGFSRILFGNARLRHADELGKRRYHWPMPSPTAPSRRQSGETNGRTY